MRKGTRGPWELAEFCFLNHVGPKLSKVLVRQNLNLHMAKKLEKRSSTSLVC